MSKSLFENFKISFEKTELSIRVITYFCKDKTWWSLQRFQNRQCFFFFVAAKNTESARHCCHRVTFLSRKDTCQKRFKIWRQMCSPNVSAIVLCRRVTYNKHTRLHQYNEPSVWFRTLNMAGYVNGGSRTKKLLLNMTGLHAPRMTKHPLTQTAGDLYKAACAKLKVCQTKDS